MLDLQRFSLSSGSRSILSLTSGRRSEETVGARFVFVQASLYMLPNQGMLIVCAFILGLSSAGFFFAQFSRSTKKVRKAIHSSGLMFLMGTGVLVAALLI